MSDFDKWWEELPDGWPVTEPYKRVALHAWTEARAAERQRIRELDAEHIATCGQVLCCVAATGELVEDPDDN